jgi:hypothetical protein
MYRIALAALALRAAVAPVAPAQSTKLESSYDRIEGKTLVEALIFRRDPFSGPRLYMWVNGAHADSVQADTIREVALVFSVPGSTDGPARIDPRELTLLLDDTVRIRVSDGGHRVGREQFAVREFATFAVPLAQLAQIASAGKVEGRVGAIDFEIRRSEMAPLRDLLLVATMAPDAPRPRKSRGRRYI